ncbi:helix-turn-helix transcriptional regulator [Oryzibacter oryziterrae]|uniref:helix-turn-helix transcriptional regulator n=1 Tax=Oryzibacter oryziterrae TaxID=2766474 RepID=UPI001F29E15B|nr:helix-turn-helix domain-containing protein [Oryzibacter oryziterrae]
MIKDVYNSLHSRTGIGATAEVRQFAPVEFSGLFMPNPAIVIVRRGSKTIRVGDDVFHISAGQGVMVNACVTMDSSYELGEDGFDAVWMGFDQSVVEAFHRRYPPSVTPIRHAVRFEAWSGGMEEAFHNAAVALAAPFVYPEDIARHRMEEVLLWLERQELQFSSVRSVSLANQIRSLIFMEPGIDWSSHVVCERLGLSEATMRRRLAQEGHCLRNILTDIRMSTAVFMLQSTGMPVSQIATAVGYESHSRFALRFKDRFGFPPTVIRGHQRPGTNDLPAFMDEDYRAIAE